MATSTKTSRSAGKKPKSLAEKLVAVMAKVDTIPKRGRNTHFNYLFATESDVSDAIRKAFVEYGIFLAFDVDEALWDGDKTYIHTKHTLVNADDPDDTIVLRGYGQAMDKQDKGGNKAQTAALKYFLLKTFLVPTGDDPDAHGPVAQTAQAQPKAAPANAQKTNRVSYIKTAELEKHECHECGGIAARKFGINKASKGFNGIFCDEDKTHVRWLTPDDNEIAQYEPG